MLFYSSSIILLCKSELSLSYNNNHKLLHSKLKLKIINIKKRDNEEIAEVRLFVITIKSAIKSMKNS